MTIRRKWFTIAASLLTVTTSAACGNVTVGGLTGEATVVVSGDVDTLSTAGPSAPAAALQASGLPAAAAEQPARSPDEAEGEVQVKFLAFLVAESGSPLQLGEDELQVKVDLRGRSEMDAVDRQPVPARLYTALRLVFTDIHAEVDGLIIDGVPIPEVDVELEDLSLVVSRDIDLDIAPGASVELVVDLNTLAWLEAVDALGTVDESVFASLVNVVVR